MGYYRLWVITVWVILGLTVHPFWHNANFEKVVILNREDYRQWEILMLYYEIGTENMKRECDYKQEFTAKYLITVNSL